MSSTHRIWAGVLAWWALIAAAAGAVLGVAVLVVLPVVRWVLHPVAALDQATGRVADAVVAGRPRRAAPGAVRPRVSCAG